MTAIDNLQTNANKVRFTSLFPTDKIVYEGTFSRSVAGGGTEVTSEITNPYGIKAFITLAWSIDGTNYYPAQAYTSPTAPYTANGWVDANKIYIYMENYSGGTVTFYVKFALDSIT